MVSVDVKHHVYLLTVLQPSPSDQATNHQSWRRRRERDKGRGGGALGQFRKGQCTLTDFSPPTVCDTETKIDISICDTETKIDISICDTDTKIYISIIYLLYI